MEQAKPKSATILVDVLRRIGVESKDPRAVSGVLMIDPGGEPIELPNQAAKVLQKAGAVQVVIPD